MQRLVAYYHVEQLVCDNKARLLTGDLRLEPLDILPVLKPLINFRDFTQFYHVLLWLRVLFDVWLVVELSLHLRYFFSSRTRRHEVINSGI